MKKEITNVKRLKKLKRNIKGITLMALVVTIIVLLILAGVALNLTIGQNGIFSRAQDAANTWRNAETNEQLAMGEMQDWINQYRELEWIDGVPIPNGFYYAGGSKETGLVISDDPDDAKTFNENTKADVVPSTLKGNQFVWIPINDLSSDKLYNSGNIALSGNTNITTNYYSKELILGLSRGVPGSEEYREPDLVIGYENENMQSGYLTQVGYTSVLELAQAITLDYENTIKSLEKYKGFYLGRYELTENGVKKGQPLTNSNWYTLLRKCKDLSIDKSYSTTMIWGFQWDLVCNYLNDYNYNINDSRAWGNYNDSIDSAKISESGTKQITGFSEFWKANNIYDFAGNCYEWTQEAYASNYRVTRGGNCYDSGVERSVIFRHNDFSGHAQSDIITTRAVLYLNV